MSARPATKVSTEQVSVSSERLELAGDLGRPPDAAGVVLFAHGSGSSRFSPRNRFVAEQLHRQGLATLLIDLLTADEEGVDQYTRALRFDIPLLADRLSICANWLARDERTTALPLGLFGASTGAAAALICAAQQPELVKAVVSRGGRADLAGDALPKVEAPTLLIVGELDEVVLDLNREARSQLRCENDLSIVSGATHLFEEPGTLETVAELAAEWFAGWLRRASS